MHDVWSAVRDCGPFAYFAILFGMVGSVLGLISLALAIAAKGRAGIYLGAVAATLGALCLALGGFGWVRGRSITDGALAGASLDPAAHARIREEGYREAAQCIPVGGTTGAFPLLFGAVAVAVGFTRARKSEDETNPRHP